MRRAGAGGRGRSLDGLIGRGLGAGKALQRRRFHLEPLEPRRLLSGAHDAALVQAIQSALSSNNNNGLAAWAGKLSDPSALGQELALVGTQFASHYDPKGAINSVLSGLSGNYTTLSSLQSALAGLGNGLSVDAARSLPDDLELDLHFHTTTSTSVPLSAIWGTTFDLSGSLQLAATLDWKLTLGAYYDSTANQPVFYINAPSSHLDISATASASNLSASAHLGFLDVNVSGGSATFSPTFDLAMNDPDADGGRVTLNELNTTLISSLLQTNITTAAPTALAFSVTSSLVPGTYHVNFGWSSITSPEQVANNLASLGSFDQFLNIDPSKLSGGIDTIVNLLGDEATSQLAGSKLLQTKLPLVNKSLSDLINFPQFFHDALTRFTDVTSDTSGNITQPFTTAGELLTLLQNLPGVGAGNVTDLLSGSDIQYHLHMTGSLSQSLPINLGLGSTVNLSVNGSITANLNTTTDVTFGVDSSKGNFYVVDTGMPAFSAAASVSADINADASLGFLGVHITHGSAAMNGQVALTLHDPNTDNPPTPGIITTTELVSANLASLISVAVTGNASLSLPLSTSLFPDTATLMASWPDITNPSTLTVNTPDISKFFDFNAITPQMVLQGLEAVPGLLNKLAGQTGLGKDLAFLGSNLSSLISLGTQFQGYVSDLSSVTTAQGVQQTLQSLLGQNVSVNVSGSNIQFGLSFQQSINNSISYEMGTNKNINSGGSAVSLQAGGSLQITGSVQAALGFGVQFPHTDPMTQQPQPPQFYLLPGDASKFTASLSVNATNLNAGAKLGFLNVGIAGGTATVASAANPANPASLGLALVDPDNDGKITLSELADPLSLLGPLQHDGAVNVVLPITGLPFPGANPQVSLSWTDITDPSALSVSTQGLGDLSSALNFDGQTILAGVQAVINMLQGWKNDPVLNTKIPLINQPISALFPYADKAIAFFQQVESAGGGASSASAFDSAVNQALQAAGLSQHATLTDKSPNPNAGQFDFLLNFNYSPSLSPVAFDFGSNLLSLSFSLQPQISFKTSLEFGFDPTDGFFLVDQGAGAGPEINVSASVSAPVSAMGTFGPVTIGVLNGNANVAFTASVDLKSPDSSGKITAAELANDLGTVAVPSLSGSASLKLPMGLRIGDGGPGLTTTFQSSWNANDPTEFHFGPNNSTDPTDGFDDSTGHVAINFDPGEFIRTSILPVVQQIQKYDPITPDVVKALNYSLPLINETPLQILGNAIDEPGLNTLFQIVGVVTDVSSALGSFANNGQNSIDLSSFLGPSGKGTTGDTGTPATGGSTPGFFQSLIDTLSSYDINVPILSDPAGTIVKLLLNQSVNLVSFNPGHVEADVSFDSPAITVPVFSMGIADAEVTTQIGGSVGVFANMNIGLDSRGLTKQNIAGYTPAGLPQFLDGLYIGDTDRFQFGVTGSVHMNVGGQVSLFGFPIVTVYGQVGVELDIGAHVNDVAYQPGTNTPLAPPNDEVDYGKPGGDGKAHLDELNYLFSNYGPLCTVEPGGQLLMTGGIGFKALCLPSFIGSGDICVLNKFIPAPKLPLIDLNYPCNLLTTSLAQISGNELVMFPDASTVGKRILVSLSKDASGNPVLQIVKSDNSSGIAFESFKLSDLAAAGVNTLVVEGTAGPDFISIDPAVTTDPNSPIKYLQVNSHDGDDRIDFGKFVGSAHLLGATVVAGNGNDTITGTPSADSILAGNGNDQIADLGGNDTIRVGDGNDIISANNGNDVIVTGNGSSLIAVGNGNDSITSGGGQNTITSGTGNDTITAGDGGNQIYSTGGNNSVVSGAGADVIRLDGNGNNYVRDGGGNDSITTSGGNDTILASGGNDAIYAGDGNNIVNVGGGNDTILSGSGNDFIHSGGGNSRINAGNGDNKVIVGDGNNSILTGTGQDVIIAGAGNNTIGGGAGDDFISVGPGANQIDGGSGTNLLTVSGDVSFALTNTGLTTTTATGVQKQSTFSGIQRVTLNGGPSNNSFDVSGWTGAPVILNGNGGTDTVVSTDDGNFTLTNSTLTRSDGASFLLNGISQAQLTGDKYDNTFDVSNFTGQATLNGGSGGDDYNRVVSTAAGSYTLTDASLARAGGGTFTLIDINRATLPTGNGSSVNSNGFSGLVDLVGVPGSVATLSTAADSVGRWAELGQSATNAGASASPTSGIEPAMAAGASGQFVAWADNRTGQYQIYVAEHTASGWQEVAGSAHGGGVSNSAGDSRRPSIALDATGNPVVAWTGFNGASHDIYVIRYDPAANGGQGGWVALGASLSGGGISNSGAADAAHVVITSAGPVIAYLDSSGGVANIYVQQLVGGAWSALGSGAAGGSGVSGSGSPISELSLATDGTNVSVAWTQPLDATSQIYLRQYSGGIWSQVSGSTSSNGLSNTLGSAAQPSVAYYSGALFVAWQATVNGQANIAAAMSSGSAWTPLAIDTPPSAGNAVTRGAASLPQLSQAGSTLELLWIERRLSGAPSQDAAIYANRLNGTGFARLLPGDASFNGINWTGTAVAAVSLSVDPSGRPYAAWGDLSSGTPQIDVRGDAFAIHNIYYVNDALTPDDSFTTAAGSPSNTGTSPSSPLDSVQSVLAKYTLAAGDVILIDSGTYSGFSVGNVPAGVLLVGSGGVPTVFNNPVTLTNSQGVILQGLEMNGGLSISGGSNIGLVNDIAGAVTLSGVSGIRIERSTLGSLTFAGAVSNATVVDNTILGSVSLSGGGTSGLLLAGNRIMGGLAVDAAGSGTISGNDISAPGTVVDLSASFTGSIDHNSIHGGNLGVNYATAELFNSNRVFGNTTGVADSVNSITGGLGYMPGSASNDIFNNTTGVNLTGQMQLQHVFQNKAGVTGSGVLGSSTFDTANLIELNTTGVNFTGMVQFTRIARNNVGILATNHQTVVHNLIYRNVSAGIQTAGAADVRIINNTFYATSGNNIQVDGGSSDVQALNNILWSAGGYDLSIAPDCTVGFFSDYNDLYSSGGGKLVRYFADFTDILDWQQDLAEFDLHSIGTTIVNPTWAQPRFFDLSRDDYRVADLTAGQRSSSPTIDSGDPIVDQGLPPSRTNLLTDGGFESGLTGWTTDTNGRTDSGSPTSFEGLAHFVGGGDPSTFATQTINLANAAINLASVQNDVAVFGGRIRWSTSQPGDTGFVEVTFLDGAGNAIGAPVVAQATNTTDRWELVGARVAIPAGTVSTDFRYEADRTVGTNDSSFDNAFLYVLPNTYAPDQGAYGNTLAENAQSTATHIALRWPDLYTDWDVAKPHTIRWESYNNSTQAPVRIDLYQNGQFLLNITPSTQDNGQFTWIPQNSGLVAGTHGLSIQVSLVGQPAVFDRGTETFAIPEAGHNYYVNDASTLGDVYSTAVGSNRNDGKLPSTPKPLLTPLLRTYDLGALDVVHVDTGTYHEFTPIVLDGKHDASVTITGPTDPTKVASIARDYVPSPGPVIEVTDGATAVAVSHLTLSGSQRGVWVHNGSIRFQGSYLITAGNSDEGFRLESDAEASSLDHLTIFGSGGDGVYIASPTTTLASSMIFSSGQYGIEVRGAGDSVSNNTVTGGDQAGIAAFGPGIPSQPIKISNNVVNNTLMVGIWLNGNAIASANHVWGNARGLTLNGGVASGNWVFDNGDAGVLILSGTVSGNRIYSNKTGIQAGTGVAGGGAAVLTNDLIYANSSYGVWVRGSSPVALNNDTIYQPMGDALHVQEGASGVSVRNSILFSGSGYDLYVAADSQGGFASDFNDLYVGGSGKVANWQGTDYVLLLSWSRGLGFDAHSLSADPQFNNPAGPDGILGYSGGADHGQDDDFTLKSTSPAIDAGDPASYWLSEPQPSGGRANLGSDGNSPAATTSPAQELQVLFPNGREQLSVGTPVTVSWRSSGIEPFGAVALIDAGGATVDNFLADSYRTDGYTFSQSFANAVNTTAVSNPAPQPVYQSYAVANSGIGSELSYLLPVPNGTYTLRLHFADPQSSGVGQRMFDIKVNGVVLQANYDIYAQSGGQYQAVAPSFTVTASGGTGLLIELVNKTNAPAILNAIELTAANPLGVANPTVDLQTSSDGGTTWTPLATHLSMDVWGRGSYLWTPAAGSSQALLRVISDNFPAVSGQSASLFSIGSGHDYYVAPSGSDAADGRSPATPMATLAALLSAYPTIGSGDTVHVVSGGYTLAANVLIGAAHNGLTITGPADASAVLSRNNTASGSFGIEVQGSGVTLQDLTVSGGVDGIHADASASNLHVLSCKLLGNSNDGLYIDPNSSGDSIVGNTASGQPNADIEVRGPNATVSGNTLTNSNANPDSVALSLWGAADQAVNNTVSGNSTGILLENNGAVASGNVVFGNFDGFLMNGGTANNGNRIYANTDAGVVIALNTNTLSGNRIYSNDTGVRVGLRFNTGGSGVISNNLIYANTTYGIWARIADPATIVNDTVYQPTGDAVHVEQNSSNVSIRNSILWAQSGYDLYVTGDSQVGFGSDYNDLYVTGKRKLANWQGTDYAGLFDWSRALALDGHSISADPLFNNPAGADGILGYDAVNKVDHGRDDDFTLKPASPAIDAGDPASYWLSEPQPNGGRVNIGSDGNSNTATASPARNLQLLAPGGFDKLTVGTPVKVTWRSYGLGPINPVALIDAGGGTVGDWLADSFQVSASSFNGSTTSPVDTSGISNPAPQEVYQTYSMAQPGSGNELSYQLPVPNGSYTLRLHFAEVQLDGASQRVFDIKINGVVVQSGYDIFAAAGTQNKAVALSFPVNVSGGSGIFIELVNKSAFYPAIISGIEVDQANPAGVATPKVDLQFSVNAGVTWSTLASGLTTDPWGRGTYAWTPTAPSQQAMLRVVSDDFAGISGQSATASPIGSGHDFYVAATGSNANDGRSPSTPMSSLQAVLAAYPNLGSGDTIHIASGTYVLPTNIVLGPAHSGLTIVGPADESAVLNRNNATFPDYAIELQGASHVTLQDLTITGSYDGVHTTVVPGPNGQAMGGGEFLTVANCTIYANAINGALVDFLSDHPVFTGDTVYQQETGINISSTDAVVTNNVIYNNSGNGVEMNNTRAVVTGNLAYGNRIGIYIPGGSGLPADVATVSGNTAHDNTQDGIDANGCNLTNNITYNQASGDGIGLYGGTTTASANVSYANMVGISNNNGATASDNRVYNNSQAGIIAYYASTTVGNHVYSNGIGIQIGAPGAFTTNWAVADNVIYANVTQGVLGRIAGQGVLVNNTIYQPSGDAIRFQETSQNVSIFNNIARADAGYDLYVAPDSQMGLVSDYNDLFKGSSDPRAHVAFWNNATQDQLANWQSASGQDAHSISADPLWVDIAGADNVLGYNSTTKYDGGQDDNFFLSAHSPAIDRADSWDAWHTDALGYTRVDDPGTPNTGSPDYVESQPGGSSFAAGGVAQHWNSSNASWSLNLPFSFPFYGKSYSSVNVDSQGFLQFGSTTFQGHSDAALAQNPIIAPLWASIRTDGPGNDIFVDTSTAGQVTVRWNASNATDGSAVNFSVTLFSSGQIRFDYGAGNTNLSPTIGISSGNGQAYSLSVYDGQSSLANAASVQFTLVSGFRDLGAYEFRGSSSDTVPPQITTTTPAAIQSGGTLSGVSQVQLTFSKPLNDIDASASGNYQLIGAGPDGVFGNADDVYYTVAPTYVGDSTNVTLAITGASSAAGAALPWNGQLPDGQYRLTVYSNASGSGIHDLSGLKLDGNGNGVPGGNYVRTFSVHNVGTISGRIYNDANNSGSFDAGETGLAGWTVSLDQISNGVTQLAVATTVTDSSGVYTFSNLTPGTYVVHETVNPGYARTDPLSNAVQIAVGAGQTAAGPVFGDVLISSVKMDFAMLVKLARHFGGPGTFATGDLNGDGVVNFTDLVILARNYGHALSGSPAIATTSSASIAPIEAAVTASLPSDPAGEFHRARRHRISSRASIRF